MARAQKSETVRLHMIVRPNGFLAPATAYDEERLSRFRTGSTVEIIEPHQPKNEDKQRLYRAIVAKVAKAIGVDADVLHIRIKLETGRVHSVAVWADDDVRLVPISVADMDAPAFDSYFDDAVEIITTRIIPGFDVDAILEMGWEHLSTLAVHNWRRAT